MTVHDESFSDEYSYSLLVEVPVVTTAPDAASAIATAKAALDLRHPKKLAPLGEGIIDVGEVRVTEVRRQPKVKVPTLAEDEVREVVEAITYRDGWTFEVDNTHGVPCVTGRSPLLFNTRGGDPVRAAIAFYVQDIKDAPELIEVLAAWIRAVEAHEVDEYLMVDGELLADPHEVA